MKLDEEGSFYFSALILTAFMFLIYALELLIPGLEQSLALKPAIFYKEPWTILTSVFIHSKNDIMHLLNNMFFLAIFGTLLERWIKTKRFLILFVLAGIVANLSSFTFYYNSTVLGASGAISGIVIALSVLKPRSLGLAMGVPMPMWGVALVWFSTNIIMSLGGIKGVASEAHLYGAFFGFLTGFYLRKSIKIREESSKNEVEISEKEIEKWEEKYMED